MWDDPLDPRWEPPTRPDFDIDVPHAGIRRRMNDRRLSILMVATKPPYPPVDGGRLLMWNTIRELADRGHRITFVSPLANSGPPTPTDIQKLGEYCRVRLVEARARRLLTSLVISRLVRKPVSAVRHAICGVRGVVGEELDRQRYDVLHVEQIQALQNVPIRADSPPVILRCQNVESKLFEMLGSLGGGLGIAALWESREMRRFEKAALQRASLAISLTENDRQDLRQLSGLPNRAIRTITAPFPAQLPTGVEPLAGEPAVVLMDGPWWPIRESTDWFVKYVWPEVRRDIPQAVVHCFGDRQSSKVLDGFVRHAAPSDSSTVFARNAVLVVPLRVASGLRMKILESWARGIPVVATPDAAKGLDARDGENLLLASSGRDFARALGRFTVVGSLRESLVHAGRNTLQEHHDPERIGNALVEAYVALSGAKSSAGIGSHDAHV